MEKKKNVYRQSYHAIKILANEALLCWHIDKSV